MPGGHDRHAAELLSASAGHHPAAGAAGSAVAAVVAAPTVAAVATITCGAVVAGAITFVQHRILNNDSVHENDDDSTDDSPDPSDQKNIDNAESEALKKAREARDRAGKEFYENPTEENARKYTEAGIRYGCLLGQLTRACNR